MSASRAFSEAALVCVGAAVAVQEARVASAFVLGAGSVVAIQNHKPGLFGDGVCAGVRLLLEEETTTSISAGVAANILS